MKGFAMRISVQMFAPPRLLSPLLALLALSVLPAATAAAVETKDVLGTESFGEGVKGAVALVADQHVRSGSGLAQIVLEDAPGSNLILNPNSEVHLQRRPAPGGGTSLVICLDAGAVQVKIGNKGGYEDVHVLGSALDVRVTGTLFVVERVKRDTDYVALVQGKLSVGLRHEVAEAMAAGANDHADLVARQGVGGGPNGIGSIDALSSRPQLGGSTSSIQEKGLAPAGPGGGGWDVDEAQADIDALAFNGGPDGGPVTGVVVDDIADKVADSIAHGIDTQITNDVMNQTLGAPGDLGAPPGPPF